jgi:hypothetical protein
MAKFKDLMGQVFSRVYEDPDYNAIVFERYNSKNNKVGFILYHEQDCCESVYIESVVGNLKDLENTPILMAEESEGDGFTFYKLATIKGYIDIRFNQDIDSYYSVSVNLVKMGADRLRNWQEFDSSKVK